MAGDAVIFWCCSTPTVGGVFKFFQLFSARRRAAGRLAHKLCKKSATGLNTVAAGNVLMTSEDRQRLLAAARQGDMEAFAAVFESLRPVVHSVAYRLVGADDADDVVSETFLKAWKALPNFQGQADVKTWLYRITHNCALDFIRARQRRPADSLSQNPNDDRTINDLEDERAASPSAEIEQAEGRHRLQAAIAQLDEAHRVTVLLRYADDLSYKEIAAATGVSMGTVMSRLFNAKLKLQRLLRD